MDATTLNTVVGVVGIVVGIIGIVVGVIGWNSLNAATEINNKARAGKGSTINQGNTYQYGVSEDTVRLISKDMTKEQMCRLVLRLIPVNTDSEENPVNKLRRGELSADRFEEALNELPKVYFGKKEPLDHKEGTIWFKSVE